ncbi:MAG: glycoside hydrolase family 3 C-terminal domain-containing protein [Bacteroidetes bacterium]|nr:glycoside hydrolase family 3 C-terminal domain-containing protein [Bacteroidota bacterium]
MKRILISLSLFFIFITGYPQQPTLSVFNDGSKYPDFNLPVPVRVKDLVSRMTLGEKVLQMQNEAPAIPRLGIPAYNWWNECLHGVARNGVATVFPQAIGMAATWDPDLIGKEADVISTEARAKYNEAIRKGEHGIYQGLTFWSPNINIFRDPRWGRGQETYGEDPYLTGRIGVAFVKGLQGNDPDYFKVISTAKHFAVHSGPESTRHKFDAWCSERDLYETYLPAFEALIREGKAYSVMGAYNRFWSQPCTGSDLLLDQILRKKWGFQGYVVSDCGAIWDMFNGHALVPDDERASVLGVKAGCDLTCGDEYGSLVKAVKDGYISETEIDRSLERLFTARFRLGMFDPDSLVPFSRIPFSANATDENRKLSRKVAKESIVLLKNDAQTLPLSKSIRKITVIGSYAEKLNVLEGNYHGKAVNPVTILQGLKSRAGNSMKILYSKGYIPLEETGGKKDSLQNAGKIMENEAISLAKQSDLIVFVGGISPDLEGEESPVQLPGFSGGDRTDLNLPSNQEELLKQLSLLGKPVVLVLTGGSALALNWEKDHIPAILMAWYPGEQGGNAIADVVFGDYNPAGRLPVTFYKSVNDLPPFEDYSMKGRTYRYFEGTPLFAFGHGLSYSSFLYFDLYADKLSATSGDTIILSVTLKNEGDRNGDEVIQVYARKTESKAKQPIQSLKAFKRVSLLKGEIKTLKILLPVRNLAYYDTSRQDYMVESGNYELGIGAASDDIRLKLLLEVKE